MLSIMHNMAAMNANRNLNIVNTKRSKSAEKLSSGYRINRSADDAAGLAISEKMRRLIRGLTQASENVQDGVSFCQVADGALNEVHDILGRISELAVKSANGTNTDEDREYMDLETQELKDELDRIFRDTSFNEKYIWRDYYIPGVSANPGQELDFQTYNDTTGHTGGILVNHIRYNWSELGLKDIIQTDDDGKEIFTESGTKTITFDDGEELELSWTKDDAINNITRVNRWEADGEGITINKNSSEKITWAEMGIDVHNVTGGTYSFQYHGTTISFEVPSDDHEMQDIIDGINGDNISDAYWITVAVGTNTESAVNSLGTSVDSSASDDYLLSTDWTLHADDEGVYLSTSAGDDTKIAWSDFADSKTKNYAMTDFGTSSETSGSITLDNTATYKYTGSNSGLTLSFKVSDSTSKGALIGSLDGMTFKKYYYAEMDNVTVSDSTTGISAEIDTSSLNFAMQNVLGRTIAADSFNVSSSWADGTLTVSVAGDDKTAVYTAALSEDALNDLINNKGTTSLSLSLSNYDELNATISDSERNEGLKSLQNNLSVSLDFSSVTDTATAAADAESFLNGISATANADETSVSAFISSRSLASSTSTIFDYTTIVPKKQLDIQAGSEAGQHIHMEWDILSLGTLSMGGLSVGTVSEAEAAIGTVKKAMSLISYQRSYFGAMQNRMEHTIANLDNIIENTTAAESQIRDTDMAKEMVAYSTQNIIAQVGQSVLAQANQQKQGVLSLLQ